ncbi:MAG: small-conductance mechanosensitive channel [Marivirga sp.]|jgi:small-conductance mechanosensitive channel
MIVNILYRSIRTIQYSLLASFLCMGQPLMAQDDLLIQPVDSIGNLLEKVEIVAKDSTMVSMKPKATVEKTINKKSIDAIAKLATPVDSNKVNNTSTEKVVVSAKVQEDSVLNETITEKVSDGANQKLDQISDLVSGDNIFWSIIFLLFGYVVVKVLSYILNALAERSPSYRIAFKGAIPIIKIVTWVIIITLIIVVVFKPSITTMLAFSASIGVAVGFASQDILKNVFAGIVILFDRPFVSGDKIEVDKYYGEVVAIGLRSTRIVTPDDSLVSVPNSVMMSGSVSNANSGELNCQVVAEIYLPNEVDTIAVRSIATEAASVSRYIYLSKPITILFFHEMNQQGSYLKMRVKAYVMDTRDEFRFKSDMTELIINELVKERIL